MNSLERVLAAVGLEDVDRPPVVPVMLMQGARVLDMPLDEYFKRPVRLAEGQLGLLERFGHDGVFAFPHIVQDVMPWGAGIDFHGDGPPSVNKMVFSGGERFSEMKAPDPTANPYLRHSLEAARSLAREVKGDKLIVGAVIGPFSLPTMLMGTRKFLDMVLDTSPATQRELAALLDLTMAYSTSWANAQLEAGCDLVVYAEGIASATILDEKTFLSAARPRLLEFARRVNGFTALELVGYGLPFLKHLREAGVVAYLLGGEDHLPESRRAIGSAKALIGNLNNLKLLRWDPSRIQFEARRAIEQAGPGFILSNQGPEIPWEVPDEAIHALVAAAGAAAGRAEPRVLPLAS